MIKRRTMAKKLGQIKRANDLALRKHVAESLVLAVTTGDVWFVGHAFTASRELRASVFLSACMEAAKVYSGLVARGANNGEH